MSKSKDPRWVIVLRNTKTGKIFIWQTDGNPTQLLRRAHLYFKAILNNGEWTKEADDFIRARYPYVGAIPLVDRVSQLLCRRVSPNAIRGRYWRIKKVSPDDIQYPTQGPVGEGPHLTIEGAFNARSN